MVTAVFDDLFQYEADPTQMGFCLGLGGHGYVGQRAPDILDGAGGKAQRSGKLNVVDEGRAHDNTSSSSTA